MLTRRIIPRRDASTTSLALIAALAVGGPTPGPASGQSRPPVASPEAAATADAGDVVAAYSVVRDWLDAFSLPSPKDEAAQVPISGATGVCIVLRRAGREVGVGAAVGGDAGMLRRAAGRAFGATLADRSVAGLPEALRHSVGARLTLELEVAGSPRPLVGPTFERIERTLDPGLDAIGIRRGDRWAMVFPSQLRAAGRVPQVPSLVRGLAADVDLPPADPQTLRREHGAALYRLPTVHLTQAAPDRPAFETFRGQVLVSSSSVSVSSIAATADGLASHVMSRFIPAPPGGEAVALGFAGDYLPHLDRYQPLLATPLEQALLALALADYATCPGVDPETAALARAAAERALRELARVEPGEAPPTADLASCAAIVLAADRIGPAAEEPDQRMLTEALARLEEPLGEVPTRPRPHALGLVAAAHARRLAAGDTTDRARTRAAIDAAWGSTRGAAVLGLLPWIALAELDWSLATGEPPGRGEDLRGLLELLDRCRIGQGLLEGPPDLHGGFALSGADFSGSRAHRATAQSLRPAAGVAVMLRQPELTGPERTLASLGRHLETIRFLMQLSVRPESLWSVRDAGRALGGVRAAPWDGRQPAAAQAMGLLMLAETLRSLDALPSR